MKLRLSVVCALLLLPVLSTAQARLSLDVCRMLGGKVQAAVEAKERGVTEHMALRTLYAALHHSKAHSQEAHFSTLVLIEMLPHIYASPGFATATVEGELARTACEKTWRDTQP